jgi:hypothetical protein
MSREIEFSTSDYSGSNPLYAVAYLVADTTYVNGTSLESYSAAHWTNYAITLTRDNTAGVYYSDFPAVANGDYFVRIYEQLSGTAATTDSNLAEGLFTWSGGLPVTVPSQFDIDASVFFNVAEFAELVTYNVDGGNSYQIPAIVDRNPPDKMDEDGHTLTNYIEVTIGNNADNGMIAVGTNRDTITLTPKLGGSAREHLVEKIIKQDAGAWHLAVR